MSDRYNQPHSSKNQVAQDAVPQMSHNLTPFFQMTLSEVFDSVVRDLSNFAIYYSSVSGAVTTVDNHRIERLTDLRDRIDTAIEALHDGRS